MVKHGIDTSYNSVDEASNHTRPKCADCSLFMNHVDDIQRWVCVQCCLSIPEQEIQYSRYNSNAKYLGQLSPSALAKQQQQQQQKQEEQISLSPQREQQFANSSNAVRPRIVTERGASTYSPGFAIGGGVSDSNHSVFQSFDPRANLIRERRRSYSDHSRTNVKDQPTFIHPLDKELVECGYQIREVHEMPRLPNSPNIVKDNKLVDQLAAKPYPRYIEDTGGIDPYDQV
jgi:hypothetical protein